MYLCSYTVYCTYYINVTIGTAGVRGAGEAGRCAAGVRLLGHPGRGSGIPTASACPGLDGRRLEQVPKNPTPERGY